MTHPPKASAAAIYAQISAIRALASGIIITILAIYYIRDVGMNPFQLAITGTVFEAAILLCEVPTGVIADLFGRRRSVILGIMLFGGAVLLEGSIASFAVVLLAESIAGVGESCISGALDAWLADHVGEAQLGPAYLRAAQAGRIGTLAGIALGAGLGCIQLNIPIMLAGALYLGLALWLLRAMPEQPQAEPGSPAQPAALLDGLRESLGGLRASPVLRLLLIVNLIGGAATEGFDRLWEAHLLESFALPSIATFPPAVWFGLINGATALISIAVAALFQQRLERIDTGSAQIARFMIVANSLLAGSIIGFGLAPSFGAALLAVLLKSIGSSISEPLYRAWLIRNTPPRMRATMLSLSSQVNACGEIAGGPALGAVALRRSLRAALLLSGALITPTLAIFGVAQRIYHGHSGQTSHKHSEADLQ